MCTLGTCRPTLGRHYRPSLGRDIGRHTGGQSVVSQSTLGRYSVDMTVEHRRPPIDRHVCRPIVNHQLFDKQSTLGRYSIGARLTVASIILFYISADIPSIYWPTLNLHSVDSRSLYRSMLG